MLSERVLVEITTADVVRTMNELNAMNIRIHHAKMVGEISALLQITANDYLHVVRKIEKDGGKIVLIGRQGLLHNIKLLATRPLLVIGILALIILSLWLPSRILFIETKGNDQISDKLLLQEAEACGLRFGGSRRALRSEEVKNQLLERIPQLQWVGVNTAGCVATISVREKDIVKEVKQESAVSSIVASTDGIITHCIVRKGNLLCAVGQAVKSGQMLVSGYIDCGVITQATQADAEIIAQTLHNLSVVTPAEHISRGKSVSTTEKYSLQVGKKLINFFIDSGISDTTCVKMYEKKYLMLPGGHCLPIVWIIEKEIMYETKTQPLMQMDAENLLQAYSSQYLSAHMIAGSILTAHTACDREEDIYSLEGKYLCREMIGQIKREESLITNGENS